MKRKNETKVQIRPLVKMSVVFALEEIRIKKSEEQNKNISIGKVLEELLLESETFKKFYKV